MSQKFKIQGTSIFILLLVALTAVSQKKITVYAIGDESMAEYALTSDKRSWMQMIPMFFSMNVHFQNEAAKVKSAGDYLKEGYWNIVSNQIREGDYVFISFGKEGITKADNQNAAEKFITDINQKKAIPVFYIPIQGNDRTFITTLCEKENTVCIDLQEVTKNLFEKEKQDEHGELSVYEAIKVAGYAASAVMEKIPELNISDVQNVRTGVQPTHVLGNDIADIIPLKLRHEAALDFNLSQLPVTKSGWESHRKKLKSELLKSSGAKINHSLPLDVHETGSIKMEGYTIKKIYFQTRPNVYATANLYVPDGKGPFPAIINMHGHWPNGKAGEMVQPRAHELALNGYVCLNIDAWGSGERTSIHGMDEYHGSNLGASLMNIGETLLGNQLTDNMRGVDLLCSLPYVDKTNIGATGASGGGNQTMWLSALDERIKASMPVVSVGTFQSYIMGSNCVCELMPEGLTYTEESGVLALIAPRSVKICSALKDASPTFYPSEMIRSYDNAKPIFSLYDQQDNIQYQLFNTPHGYWPEIREAMLGWFDMKLKGKGNGDFKKEVPFTLLSNDQLMVFPKGKRAPVVTNTSDYCIQKSKELLQDLYENKSIDTEKKLPDLRGILLLPPQPDVVAKVHKYEKKDGWYRIILETSNKHLIPLRYFPSARSNTPAVILCTNSNTQANEKKMIEDYINKGYSVAVVNVWGTGELASAQARAIDGRLPEFHTLARAELWLGHSIMGEWVSDISNVIQYVKSNCKPSSITIDASGEIAIAALMQSALHNNTDTCILRTCPVSYALDKREGIDFFNMAIHVPGILKWGDVSLIAALNQRTELIFSNPVSITGEKIMGMQLSDYKTRFSKMKKACKSENNILFTN